MEPTHTTGVDNAASAPAEAARETPPRKRHRTAFSKASEVARRAGVSLMTVSRVFNHSESVAPETRKRVLAASAEVGYESNRAARALRTGHSDAVGLLMESHMSLRGEFNSEFLAAFEDMASRRGLEVLISVGKGDEPLWKRAQSLAASGTCGGLVVRHDTLTTEDVEALSLVKAPLVLANYHRNLPTRRLGLRTVGFDNRRGARSAVRHLVSLGHKRIAYLGGTPGWMDSVDREQGFRDGMAEYGIAVEERWVEACDFASGFESGLDGAARILSRLAQLPTAIVCASDDIATGALSCLRRWGKQAPRDVSITGFDDSRWSAYSSTPLTTIRHSGWALGEAVAASLLDLMQGDADHSPREAVLELQLIVRDSTGPAPD